ncbi:protein BIG GRAIN 1-like A [Euphorbia lathyris]|uniref:protein BIG GRAIN 1-like A n=1 Tax=Euphorbia lathyris TaxID=212925 RepID=UPI003313D9D6
MMHNPSFSSTLLDHIYRSISETDSDIHPDPNFYTHTMPKKQTNLPTFNFDKWIDHNLTNIPKSRYDLDQDQDAIFFSSTSISSDSSSGGFSSSDTDSIYTSKSKSKSKSSSSALPIRPKPVRTTVSAPPHKTETTLFGDYHYSSSNDETPKMNESIFKSKSRALKIYNNLKKLKQPISPGGKLSNFINSIFPNTNSKKSKNPSVDQERKFKSGQTSTCSSASSFSRSCLSKSEKCRDGVKRSVRFYPVSVIVDEDCRPCGHKSLYEEEQSSSLMSVSVPTAWKIGKSQSKKSDNELKYRAMENSRRVEKVARDLLRKYHHNQKKNEDQIMKNVHHLEDEEEDDDDAASYSSSDLFEIDHLSVIGKYRYCEELPVYETTRLHTNRAIANGLIM